MATVLLLIIVLAVVVLIHECGHFIVAKLSGIEVEEFGLGLPPRAFGKKLGKTLYSINWIPFGGFVRIAGDDEDSTPGKSVVEAGRSFKDKSFLTKTSVLVGGVVANIYLGFALVTAALVVGLPVPLSLFPSVPAQESWVSVVGVLPQSPAFLAQIPLPSRVNAIGIAGERMSVENPSDITEFVQTHPNELIDFYMGNTKTPDQIYSIKPSLMAGSDVPVVGFQLEIIGIHDFAWFQAFKESFRFSGQLIVGTLSGLANLVTDALSGKASLDSVSGPVGIALILAEAKSQGAGTLLFIVALISLSLGVINVVPFPALDGGRLAMLAIESLSGRPIKVSVARVINAVGFFVLLGLMFFITYHDIIKL